MELGAETGSVVPGAGTVIGGVLGGAIGAAAGWYGGAALGAFANNKQAKGRADGEIRVIQHLDWLGGSGKGEDPDPRDRDKWKKDVSRHLKELRKRIDQISGDRNKQPYEEKLKDLTDQLNHTK